VHQESDDSFGYPLNKKFRRGERESGGDPWGPWKEGWSVGEVSYRGLMKGFEERGKEQTS